MQRKQIQIENASRLLPLLAITLALVMVVGCSQEKLVEKKPDSVPKTTVEFNGPGKRVDASFQGTSPE